MIETYGYLAAVEASDSALKAANVTLTDVVRVKGGLVTVLIEGDVGAVKAAVDAAAAAAERVGTVVGVHVIPRPSGEVARMLSDGRKTSQKAGKPCALAEESTARESLKQETLPEAPEDPASREQTEEADELLQQEDEVPVKEEPEEPEVPDREQMEKMTVAKLRTLARKLNITTMTSREIRFAKKQELIEAIMTFTDQER